MRVQDLMTHPVVTCHVNDTLFAAARLMWDHDCGAVAVVNDDGLLTGLITDRDICMAAFTQGRAIDEILINSAMAPHVVTVQAGQPVDHAAQLMAHHQVRRLPVIDERGYPLGMLSLNDIAVESVQPDTRMKNGTVHVAHTLAAISQPRHPKQHAA